MNKKSDISVLIFDLGGVLVDLDWKKCTDEFEKIGVKRITEILSTTVQKDFILEFECGKITTQEFCDKIRELGTKPITNKEIEKAWASFLMDIPKQKLDLLLELRKKYRVVMLSNTNPLSFATCKDEIFTKYGRTIDDYFDKCYLSYQMKMAKPKKDIFLQLLKKENVSAENCLFLDDGKHNVETAKSLGIQTCLVEPFSELDLTDVLEK